MKRLLFLLLVAYASGAYGQTKFTSEQQEEIERIVEKRLAEERSKILAELLDSLKQSEQSVASGIKPAEAPGQNLPPGPTRYAVNGNIAAATTDRLLSPPEPTFQIDITKDKTTASFSFTKYVDQESALVAAELSTPSQPSPISTSRAWSATLSAPIDDTDNGVAHFATLDGLSGGLSATVSHTWHRSETGFLINLHQDKEWLALCEMSGQKLDDCSLSDMQSAAGSDPKIAAALYSYAARHFKGSQSYSITAKANREKFDYITPDARKRSERDVGYGIGASAYFITDSRKHLFGFGADYQRKMKSSSSGILCPVPSSQSPTRCLQGPLGAPKRNDYTILWGEYRSDLLGYPYSVRLSHDLDSNESGVDFPIFLFRKTDGPFSAGVRLGWTESEDFDIGVFISSPFSFIPD